MQESAAGGRLRGSALATLAAALAGVVYLGALGSPFVWDDHRVIVDNPSIRDLRDLRDVLLGQGFRPLVNLSYALDHALWGLSPVGYHVQSVMLHMATVALLFRLTVAAAADSEARAPGSTAGARPTGLAFAAAALFAVHPMATEAVAYASARPDVLSAALLVPGLLALRRALLAGGGLWMAAALAWLALAALAKEVALVLPLAGLAWDRLLLGGTPAERRRRLGRVHAPLFAVVAVLGATRVAAFLWFEGQPPPVPPWQYALMEVSVVWRYLALLLAPWSQSLVHHVPEVTMPLDPTALAAGAGLVLAGALAVRVRSRAPLAAFGAAWFLLLLLPSSSLLPLNQAMAEHRAYLANWGALLAGASGLAHLTLWLRGRGTLRSPLAPRVALGAVLVALALLTAARTLVWADPVRLWRDAASKAPESWLPHHALGDALRERGRCAEAVPVYRQAAWLRPEEPRVYPNLGVCLMELGRLDEARDVFAHALRVDPGSARVRNNLGVLALRVGDRREARRQFQAAADGDPGHVLARQNLARLLEADGDPGGALRVCRELRALAPGSPGVDDCIRRNAGVPEAARP